MFFKILQILCNYYIIVSMNIVYILSNEIDAYGFLESVLKEKFNIKMPEIKKGPHGKPYFPGTDIHFNISHSGDYKVLAIAETPVGVDIEKVRKADLRVANRFAQTEKDYVLEKDNNYRFFEIWTKKEAYLKYKGTGLRGGLDSFDVFSLPEDINTFRFKEYFISVCGIKEFKTEVIK